MPHSLNRDVSAGRCKFHPALPARYLCGQCGHGYCEACVGRRSRKGGTLTFCRHCGIECLPLEFEAEPAAVEGYFARWPGAFVYPLRGSGIFSVLVGVAIFGLVKAGFALMSVGSLRLALCGIFLEISVLGYCFAWLENIIHSTVAEDREIAGLPAFGNYLEDLLFPFCKFLGLAAICLGPLGVVAIWTEVAPSSFGPALLAGTLGLGFLYFPMALLSVCVFDSILAANPLLVVPSILKVLGEYLMTLLVLGGGFGAQWLAGRIIRAAFPDGWTTQSMVHLFAFIGALLISTFIAVYLLMAGMHSLGLIYVSKKDSLDWQLSHRQESQSSPKQD